MLHYQVVRTSPGGATLSNKMNNTVHYRHVRHTLALMCSKNHLLIFSGFLDIWENVEWPRFFWTTLYFADIVLCRLQATRCVADFAQLLTYSAIRWRHKTVCELGMRSNTVVQKISFTVVGDCWCRHTWRIWPRWIPSRAITTYNVVTFKIIA